MKTHVGWMRGKNPLSGWQSVTGCCCFGSGPIIKALQDGISQMNHTEEDLGQGVNCPAWISSVTMMPVSLCYGASLSKSWRSHDLVMAFAEAHQSWAWGHSGNIGGFSLIRLFIKVTFVQTPSWTLPSLSTQMVSLSHCSSGRRLCCYPAT